MKDLTKEFPLGCKDYCVVDISDWVSYNWLSKEYQMLNWLKEYDNPSWFAYERPRGKILFQDSKIATEFILKWS